MSTEESKAVIRRLFEEFYDKRNVDVLDGIVAPDYVRRLAKAGWIADGRIAEDWEADNEGTIWQQLGLLTPPGS